MLKLKEIRIEKGFTQEEVAKILNIQRPAISKMERNLTTLKHEQIIVLCKFLKVRADRLLGLEEKKGDD